METGPVWFGKQAGGKSQSMEDGARSGGWGRDSCTGAREEVAPSAPELSLAQTKKG